MDWATVGACVTLALLGALHCAGMCGGFAILVAGKRPGSRWSSLTAYCIGKAITYSVLALFLGAAVGLLGHGVAHRFSPQAADHVRQLLAVLCGAVLVLAGLSLFGVPLPGARRFAGIIARALGPLTRGARTFPGLAGPLAVGLCTGFLPCGLSLAALVLASGTDRASAVVSLFAFGLATSPALVVAGLLGERVCALGGRRSAWIFGGLLIVLGAFTAVRGDLFGAGDALPECCASTK